MTWSGKDCESGDSIQANVIQTQTVPELENVSFYWKRKQTEQS